MEIDKKSLEEILHIIDDFEFPQSVVLNAHRICGKEFKKLCRQTLQRAISASHNIPMEKDNGN